MTNTDRIVNEILDGLTLWVRRIACAAHGAQAEAVPVRPVEVTLTVNVADAKEAHRLILILRAAVRDDSDYWSGRRGDDYLDDEIPF